MCTYIFGLVAMIHPNPCWFWKQPSVVMGAVSSLVVHPRVPVGVLRLCGEELLVCCVIHPTVVALFWSLMLVKVVWGFFLDVPMSLLGVSLLTAFQTAVPVQV